MDPCEPVRESHHVCWTSAQHVRCFCNSFREAPLLPPSSQLDVSWFHSDHSFCKEEASFSSRAAGFANVELRDVLVSESPVGGAELWRFSLCGGLEPPCQRQAEASLRWLLCNIWEFVFSALKCLGFMHGFFFGGGVTGANIETAVKERLEIFFFL